MSESYEIGGATALSPLSPSTPGSLSDRVQSLRLPPRQARAAGGGGKAAWFLCFCLAVVAAYLGYREWERSAAPSPTASGGDNAVDPAVRSATAGSPQSTAPGGVLLESKGYIVAKHQILISPKVAGVIEALFVDEGKIVKKDDVLAVLETDEYRFDRDRAAALLNQAKARLEEMEAGSLPEEKEQSAAEKEEAEAQLKQTDLSFRRNQLLRKSASAAAAELETAEASWRAMEARVKKLANAYKLVLRGPREEKKAAAKADLAQAQAELDRTQWRLNNCKIRSPINGVILKKNAEQGNIVNPVAFNGSYSICDVADLTDLEVDLTIQERDFARVYDGQKCKVRPEAYSDRVYEGVARRMPIGDRSKGAVPVRVKITVPEAEAGQFLRPEMGAVVAFLKAEK